MQLYLVLALGFAIVVGGILLLRLHAFIALILAAMVVASLTPMQAHLRPAVVSLADASKIEIQSIDERTNVVELKSDGPLTLTSDETLSVVRISDDLWRVETIGTLAIADRTESTPTSPVDGQQQWQAVFTPVGEQTIEATDLVVPTAALVKRAADAAKITASSQVAAGLGSTAASVGILIAFASIIGKCLLDSRSADRVITTAIRFTGESGAPAAFVASGFVLGIPIFFDTVFYLMLPLGKSLSLRTGRNFLLHVLTIVAGATMAHSLVPPTPGPLLVATELGVGIGTMMLMGTLVGCVTVSVGYLYARALNARFMLKVPESRDETPAAGSVVPQPDDSTMPPLWLALLPLLLPIALLGLGECIALGKGGWTEQVPANLLKVLAWLGDKNIAIMLAAAVAMATLVWARGLTRRQMAASMQEAILGAGGVILVTSAGGAFGKVLQQTGVASLFSDVPNLSTPAVLAFAFLVTAAIRTAQGSATVAMITSVGMFAPLAAAGQLGFHPVWLALAIGCGSKPICWMNDSGFWVITQMSGMTEGEGLKYVTTLMLVMSLAGLAAVIVGAMLLPTF